MSELKKAALFEAIRKSYWACGFCCEEAGGVWPEGHCATVTKGQCEVCGHKDQTLIPWVDYNWPKNKKNDLTAKLGRD